MDKRKTRSLFFAQGLLPTSLYGGFMSIFGSGILQKQSYLGSVKSSFKNVNIWGIELQHKKYSIFGVLELTTKL